MPLYAVIYCDKDIVVVNKAPNVPCHALASSSKESLMDALAREFPEVLSQFAPNPEGGLCHRLDNGTSGLVVVARHPAAKEKFRVLFSEGSVEKTYLAIVKGKLSTPVEIDYPIAHHAKNARKMIALTSPDLRHRSKPQEAKTSATVLLSNDKASLLRVTIGAGRRHQIRVHLASIGHPLMGDTLYHGPDAAHLAGHALHAATLRLPDGQFIEAPCPSEWDDELRHWGLTR